MNTGEWMVANKIDRWILRAEQGRRPQEALTDEQTALIEAVAFQMAKDGGFSSVEDVRDAAAAFIRSQSM